MREPLSGWRDAGWTIPCYELGDSGIMANNESGLWEVFIPTPYLELFQTLPDAQLAAEDAARAMVADMAKALGGSVTWNESEVGDGDPAPLVAPRADAAERGVVKIRNMTQSSPARVPLWLAKRQWRLDGRRTIDDARALMIGYRMATRSRADRWRFHAGQGTTPDGRRRKPSFYGA